MRVELSDEAHAQVQEIDAWWRENRRAELAQAPLMLEQKPMLGTRYEARARAGRPVLLRRTHYHFDFVERLYVVAVWSAYRGRGPKL
ncbi:MAG: hypothetical protein KF894_15825 [Labilithrix sp.]|nr:hypothetical protein [Labilithrix sp.]